MPETTIEFDTTNDPEITEIDSDTIIICETNGESLDISIPWLGGDIND